MTTPTDNLSVYDYDKDDTGCLRLHVNTDTPYHTPGAAAANADRIDAQLRALPDLIDACKRMIRDQDRPVFSMDFKGAIDDICAALQKAEAKQ